MFTLILVDLSVAGCLCYACTEHGEECGDAEHSKQVDLRCEIGFEWIKYPSYPIHKERLANHRCVPGGRW
jgi:hypothetical protein